MPDPIQQAAGNAASLLSRDIYSLLKQAASAAENITFAELEIGLQAYLTRTFDKHSKVKTILHRLQPTDLLKIYTSSNLRSNTTRIVGDDIFQSILERRRTMITGTAGAGKSFLAKRICIEFCRLNHGHVPCLIELRRLRRGGITSLESFILEEVRSASSMINAAQIRYLLRRGKFLVILDALDEVDDDHRGEVSAQIVSFADRYPKTPIAVLSRPDSTLAAWSEFEELKVEPFSIEQVVDAVNKSAFDEDAKDKFIKLLHDGLYRNYKDYLSNPLLANMMLLIFSRNAEVPLKMNLFFEETFNVLYAQHDATKELFKRHKYANLAKDDFERFFSCFCAVTYHKGVHAFSETSLLKYVEHAAGATSVIADKVSIKADMVESFCFLILDGTRYVFIHRSFQEYFTARYILDNKSVIESAVLMNLLTSGPHSFVGRLLYMMDRDYFEMVFTVPVCEQIVCFLRKNPISRSPKTFLRMLVDTIYIRSGRELAGFSTGKNQHFSDLLELLHFAYGDCYFLFLASGSKFDCQWDKYLTREDKAGYVEVSDMSNALIRSSPLYDKLKSLRARIQSILDDAKERQESVVRLRSSVFDV